MKSIDLTPDIEGYYPEHIKKIKEFQQIAKAQNYELKLLWDAANVYELNRYVDSMDAHQCEYFESVIFHVTPRASDTLDDRRARIKTLAMSSLPYTENKLREILESFADADHIQLTVTCSKYLIEVYLEVSTPSILESTQAVVYKMRPANMTVVITVKYRWENDIYIGNAVKFIKTLTPTTPTGADPISDVTWYTDETGALLVDEEGNVLVKDE